MPGSRTGRARGGAGGRASQGEGFHGGTGDRAVPSNGVAGGHRVLSGRLGDTEGKRHQPLPYGGDGAVRMEMEKGLRLRRLEQVRQQSRQQAAAVREEYRRRREENKRAAVRESERQFEASRAAELLALNQRLQANLLEVGKAHRLAACSTLARDGKEERLRANRSVSAERRRSRNLSAARKREAEMKEARRDVDAANYRQEVWRGEGEHERFQAREEAERQEAAEASRREREEFHQKRLREQEEKRGTVKTTEAAVVEVGTRLEDFKTSRVHATFVLKHGSEPGSRLLGVETAVGDPSQELQRLEALAKEKEDAEEEADYRAGERGHEAFVRTRDQRAADGVEEELKRLFELDRRHRLRNGAADTNLAALREREIRRARLGGGHGRESGRVPGADMTNLRGRARHPTGDVGQGAPGLAPEIDDTAWRDWPAWWPTPPPPAASSP
ncbi:unnamed protein product, partial [Scytosiphon promiscuus]